MTAASRNLVAEVAALQAKVRALEDALCHARSVVIETSSVAARGILRRAYSGDADPYQWLADAAPALADLAEVTTDPITRRPCACCPLCAAKSELTYPTAGYLYPDGLLRHLKGSHRVRMCPVVAAAYALGTSRWAARSGSD